ncbi:MAG: sensor [Nitrospirales bacterium]|nr:MAG: sensor [Nitrospirales bacterium]
MYESHQQPSSLPSVREQALAWVVRLRSGKVTSADLKSFDQWFRANEAHKREYQVYTKMWGTLEHVPPFLEAELEEADRYWAMHTREFAVGASHGGWSWGSALAVMSVAVVMVGCLVSVWPSSPIHEASYQTVKGEQRMVTLVDGSTIFLNTDSQVSVQMSDETRVVTMHRGEAVFTVVHEPGRPFDVQAANGIIHDIGTQFLVRHFSTDVQVAVLEGRVAVEVDAQASAKPAQNPHPLKQGEQVMYTPEGQLSHVKSFNVQTTAVWRQGQLVFVETPLSEVLDEWARYHPGVIRLDDPSLGRVPISGSFRLDNINGFFQALDGILALRPVRQNQNLIVLERQSQSS